MIPREDETGGRLRLPFLRSLLDERRTIALGAGPPGRRSFVLTSYVAIAGAMASEHVNGGRALLVCWRGLAFNDDWSDEIVDAVRHWWANDPCDQDPILVSCPREQVARAVVTQANRWHVFASSQIERFPFHVVPHPEVTLNRWEVTPSGELVAHATEKTNARGPEGRFLDPLPAAIERKIRDDAAALGAQRVIDALDASKGKRGGP